MNLNFTPTAGNKTIRVPPFEEARADFAPYYDNRDKNDDRAKSEVMIELTKLGGGGAVFLDGFFGPEKQNKQLEKRFGYVIEFWLGSAKGEIRVAGLPMKHDETERKILQIRVQALRNVRDWLKTAVTSQVFAPQSNVLIQHLLVGDTGMTVGEYIATEGKLPSISPPKPSFLLTPTSGD